MKLTYSLGVMILIGILGYTFWNNTKQVDQVVTTDMGANTALAKVISEKRVIWSHAIRNSVIPITSNIALIAPPAIIPVP